MDERKPHILRNIVDILVIILQIIASIVGLALIAKGDSIGYIFIFVSGIFIFLIHVSFELASIKKKLCKPEVNPNV